MQTFKRLWLGFCFKYLYQISINMNKKPNHFMINFLLQTIWRHLSFFYAKWNWLSNIFQWKLLLIQAKCNSLLSFNNSWLSTIFLSSFKLYWLSKILRFLIIIDYLLRYVFDFKKTLEPLWLPLCYLDISSSRVKFSFSLRSSPLKKYSWSSHKTLIFLKSVHVLGQSYSILSSIRTMIIFNYTSADIVLISANVHIIKNDHNFDRTEDCTTVLLK